MLMQMLRKKHSNLSPFVLLCCHLDLRHRRDGSLADTLRRVHMQLTETASMLEHFFLHVATHSSLAQPSQRQGGSPAHTWHRVLQLLTQQC